MWERVPTVHSPLTAVPRASLPGGRCDPPYPLTQVGPLLAAVFALEQRAVAQAGEQLGVSGRERVDVRVERPRDRLPRTRALPAEDHGVGGSAPMRLERPRRGGHEPA